jgi:hypothetical protein
MIINKNKNPGQNGCKKIKKGKFFTLVNVYPLMGGARKC